MTDPSFQVGLKKAEDPLVLALDVGSTATRGGLYDARGRPVKKARVRIPHAFVERSDGTSQIDPDQIVDELSRCLSSLITAQVTGRIGAVALDTFAASLVGADEAGTAVTPCFTYADSRSSAQVEALRQEIDEDATQQRTGTRLHTSYLPARLRWLRECHPAVAARVRHWMSLGEYAYLRLLGTTAAGMSTASWTGMANRRTGCWDRPLLSVIGIDQESLSRIVPPGQPLHPVSTHVATTWPALASVPWFAPIADGHASNEGTLTGTATGPAFVAAFATSGAMRVVAAGTPRTVPSGLWCYKLDGGHSLVGGALNDVGRATAWLERTLRLPVLETRQGALLAAPSPETPLVLPFLSGERSTGWAGHARAAFTGVSVSTSPLALYRGMAEGIILGYARVAEQLSQVSPQPREILASGRSLGTAPGILQVLADATGIPVAEVDLPRATLRGTALHALDVIAPKRVRTQVDIRATYEPNASRAEYYAERLAQYQELYDRVIPPAPFQRRAVAVVPEATA